MNEVKQDAEEFKMIYLGIEDAVDYQHGYRDSYPKGYRNPDCW